MTFAILGIKSLWHLSTVHKTWYHCTEYNFKVKSFYFVRNSPGIGAKQLINIILESDETAFLDFWYHNMAGFFWFDRLLYSRVSRVRYFLNHSFLAVLLFAFTHLIITSTLLMIIYQKPNSGNISFRIFVFVVNPTILVKYRHWGEHYWYDIQWGSEVEYLTRETPSSPDRLSYSVQSETGMLRHMAHPL